MLRASGLAKSYQGRMLLQEASFAIGMGQKVGLIGPNGAGKSTLLKVLAGLEAPDSGTIEIPGNVRRGYLPQEISASGPAIAFILGELGHLWLRMRELEGYWNDSGAAKYQSIQAAYEAADGYGREARLPELLRELGLAMEILDRPIDKLSGGERSRLGLGRVQLLDAEILLLDEPTRNLDLASIRRLEAFLNDSPSACLVVSHDRDFLDRVTTRTFEIDPLAGKLVQYSGSYSSAAQEKQAALNRQWRDYEVQKRFALRLEADIRATKEQARTVENHTVHDFFRSRAKKVAAKAKAREARLEKILSDHKQEKPRELEKIRAEFTARDLHGKVLLRCEDLGYTIGNRMLFEGIDLEVRAEERFAILGDNGTGKSTLAEIFTGSRSPTTGRIWRQEDVRIGYLPQLLTELRGSGELLSTFREALPATSGMEEGEARTFLHRFLFSRDDAYKKLDTLSGGEQVRLALAILMANGADLLVLDEPTNHLDLPAIQQFETALSEYDGAIIVISHDRRFLEAIRVAKRYVLAGGRLRFESTV